MKLIIKRVLSLVLSLVMLLGVMPITAVAGEEATITIGSYAEGVYGVDFEYYILINGAPYNGIVEGDDEQEYPVINGSLIVPCDVYVDLVAPVGSEYSIMRKAYADEEYFLPETEAKTGKLEDKYIYTRTIGYSVDDITEEEFNKQTNNGENLVSTVYVDKEYNVCKDSDVSQISVYDVSAESGIKAVDCKASSIVYYPIEYSYDVKLTQNDSSTVRKYAYNYLLSISGDGFTTATSTSDAYGYNVDIAKTTCVNAIRVSTTSAIASVIKEIGDKTNLTVSLTESSLNGVPTADKLPSEVSKSYSSTYSSSLVAYSEVTAQQQTYAKELLEDSADEFVLFESEQENTDKLELRIGTIYMDSVDNIQYYIEINGATYNGVAYDDDYDECNVVNGVLTIPSDEDATIYVNEGASYSVKLLDYNGDKLPKFKSTKPVVGVMSADTYNCGYADRTEIITKEEYDAKTNNGENCVFDIFIDDQQNEYSPEEVTTTTGYVAKKSVVNEQDIYSFAEQEVVYAPKDAKRTPIDYNLKGDVTSTSGQYLTNVTYDATLVAGIKDFAPISNANISVTGTPRTVKPLFTTSVAAKMPEATYNILDSYSKTAIGDIVLSKNPTTLIPDSSSIPDAKFSLDMTSVEIIEYKPLYSSIKSYWTSSGARYVEVSPDPEGHSFTSYIDNKDGVTPTCTSVGYTSSKTAKCDFCNAIDTIRSEEISQLEHTADAMKMENVVSATCTKSGSYDEVVRCKDCNEIISSNHIIVDKVQHSYTVVAKAYKAPTCTEKGNKEQLKCKTCSATIGGESIPANGHKVVVDKAVKATYAKAGKTEGKHCSTCKTVIVAQKSVAKLTPPTIKFSKTSGASKAIKLSWKKNTKVKRYEIRYSTSSKMKSAKTVKITKNSTTSTTIKKLSAKKTYYVQIRTVVVENKKEYPSAWSKAVSVKTK